MIPKDAFSRLSDSASVRLRLCELGSRLVPAHDDVKVAEGYTSDRLYSTTGVNRNTDTIAATPIFASYTTHTPSAIHHWSLLIFKLRNGNRKAAYVPLVHEKY